MLMKPLSIHIYTEDKQTSEKDVITQALRLALPLHTYSFVHSTRSLLTNHLSIPQSCACLVIYNAELFEDDVLHLIREYCSRRASKTVFLCTNISLKEVINQIKYFMTNVLCYPLECWPLESVLEEFVTSVQAKKETQNELRLENCGSSKFFNYSIECQGNLDNKMMFCLKNKERQNKESDETDIVFLHVSSEQFFSSNTIFLREAMQKLGISSTINSASSAKVTELTNGYLICNKDNLFADKTNYECDYLYGKDPELIFYQASAPKLMPKATPQLFPIEVRTRKEGLSDEKFQFDLYFKNLKTSNLGHVLVFFPVCETSMTISRSLSTAFPAVEGVLVVPGSQIKGKGRDSSTEWISPIGCAMMSFNYIVTFGSVFSKCFDFLEHVLTVSMVDAVKFLLGDQNFPLHIKWPNDIYYQRKYKIGGVLVTVHKEDKQYVCIAGAGINVANSKPIGCINDWLTEEQKLSVEEVIAETMNKFEYYSNLFVREGTNKFLEKYYEFWLHSEEEVLLKHQGCEVLEKVFIKQIDAKG